MKIFKVPTKSHCFSPRLVHLLAGVTCSLCLIYLLVSVKLVPNSDCVHLSVSLQDEFTSTSLEHVVFGIASNSNSWKKRKEFVKLWWRPKQMRGCVFFDFVSRNLTSGNETDSLPPFCVSEDTSRFRYTYRFRGGLRSAIRVARVVKETVALNYTNVRWFVFGDDDTVFFPDNLVKTLSKYDHGLWYYIGTQSEAHVQNIQFSFDMAFGGAGFAISYPLAKLLAKVLDSCLERYPHLYGSDARVSSCLQELGVSLTREPGFHQMDVTGDVFGLLASHPLTPLVTLHHLDLLDPIFPNMTRTNALEHLQKAAKADPHRILQQAVCYDRWFSWTISVSWGYAVQVFGQHLHLPEAIRTQETFQPWKTWKRGNVLNTLYSFPTREHHPNPCRRPTNFFLDEVLSGRDGIQTTYKRRVPDNCTFDLASPKKLREIRVFSQRLELDTKQLHAPRRHCCDLLPSTAGKVLDIAVRECKEEELIYMHALS